MTKEINGFLSSSNRLRPVVTQGEHVNLYNRDWMIGFKVLS